MVTTRPSHVKPDFSGFLPAYSPRDKIGRVTEHRVKRSPSGSPFDAKRCGAWLRPSDVDGVACFRATGWYSIQRAAYVPVIQLIENHTSV